MGPASLPTPGTQRNNRRARRFAAKWNGDMKEGWQNIKDQYRPISAPLNLGIKRFKRENPGNTKLHLQFKREAYEWYNKGV